LHQLSTIELVSDTMSGNNNTAFAFYFLDLEDVLFMDGLRRRIQIARGELPADLVLHNSRIVNVCSGECYPADVAIADGLVVGVSEPGGGYQGRE
jgi:hypothetical protein